MQKVSKRIQVDSRFGSYSIYIGSRFDTLSFGPNHVFIADSFFREMLSGVETSCIFVEANEKNKNLESVVAILAKLHSLGATKSTQIIAIGGGIVQDLATLVSSLYMRGLKWTYIPTTKMAQLDSCIGGKSSINLGGVKNIVGNIYPPSDVHIDESVEETLTCEAIASGYLEAIKISYASGSDGFHAHLELASNYTDFSKIPVLSLCELVLNQKRGFVEDDEFDSGVRHLLNFGHSFAHAIESATDYRIQHGLAVGIGMIMAMNHPDALVMEDEIRLRAAILTLLKFAGESAYTDMQTVEEVAFIRAFRSDKKHSVDSFYLILPILGGLEKKSFPRSAEVEKVLLNILRETKRELANELR